MKILLKKKPNEGHQKRKLILEILSEFYEDLPYLHKKIFANENFVPSILAC